MKITFTIVVNVLFFTILIFGLALSGLNLPTAAAQEVHAASLALQTTSTPLPQDASVIGSTDGILVMGIVIVLSATLPLLFG